jgi:hypothetical protein
MTWSRCQTAHFTTAITMYRQTEMGFWLEEFEAEMRR